MNTLVATAIGIAACTVGFAALAQMGPGPGGMDHGMSAGGMAAAMGQPGMSVQRHRYAMHNGIPEPYADAHNPLAASPANFEAGKTIFEQNCASCHGKDGRGDGPAAGGLEPRPSDLAALARRPIATDAYLEWTLSEGGVPIGSAMPPFKEALDQERIWQVVLYLRTL
jgi:mono/diheme cytochrome c family protein